MDNRTESTGLGKDGTDGVLLRRYRAVVVLGDGETYCSAADAVIVTIPDVDDPAADEDAIRTALLDGRGRPVRDGF